MKQLKVKLHEKAYAAIGAYLQFAPRNYFKRGRRYFQNDQVVRLECIEPSKHYEAGVVGSEDYEVTMVFSKGEWTGQCSCPVGLDCKHVIAAFMALQAAAEEESEDWGAASARPHPVIQPPQSPLYCKLIAQLGRELVTEEAQFIRVVQSCYSAAQSRKTTESDLELMSGRPGGFRWTEISIAREKPRDDYEFWLYAAWELRRRGWAIPSFMETITDLRLIEEKMAAWQHEKEIQRWTNWFRGFAEREVTPRTSTLELRVLLLANEARLQWRSSAASQFADFRQTDAKRFSGQFQRGQLSLDAESLPIWSALHKPWDYENWWSFQLAHGTALAPLNRLLRMPLGEGRIVTSDGQPLRRASEPLRFEVLAADSPDGNYELALMKADGTAPPKILCVFDGQPAFYLTAEGLFEGPPAGAVDDDLRKKIPARALETADGVRFLKASGVALPERIKQRVRTVRVVVTIACELKTTYPGSANENIYVKVTAEAPRMAREQLTPQGWSRDKSVERRGKRAADGKEIILHDRAAQSDFPLLLEPLALRWDVYGGGWYVRVTKKTPAAFVDWLKSLPPEVEVLLDKELATLRDEPVSGSISLDVSEAGIDWFDLKVALNVADTTLTAEELKLLLNARGGYVRLEKKGWRRLQFNVTAEEDEELARLGLNPRDFSSEPQRFHALQLADKAAKRFLAPERVERIERRVSELKTRVAPALPRDIHVQMRPYQTDGFHFLAYLASNRFGGVLADDMGLGKTIQALAWLAWLRNETTSPPPSLVVCPKSVMENWRAEAQRFYPGLRVRVWRGEPAGELATARDEADLIVVNYSQMRSLLPAITDARWLTAILDEAQYIKNPDSQTAQAARGLKAEHRLALTGTPIENRLLDLWSILAFAMPGALGNRAHFLKRFDAKDDPLARRRLAARVRPFLLRRTKSQVAKDLPDRMEEDLLCELEGEQKTLYRAELKRARQIILGLKTNKQLNEQRFNILTSLLRLRQICCHPALVDEKLRRAESAKVAALEDVIESLMEEGHKALVFSQFVTMLELLREKAKERGWRHFYLAGDTENRGELVNEFQNTSGSAVFFISLKAGGFGLNLTAASYVVLFDPWWNPAVENQAIDRTHRIGQTSKVIAYRLLMRETIEEKIRALQKQKARLAEDVLGEEKFAQSLTLDDLKFLFAE